MKRPALPLMLLILASIFLLFLLNLLLGCPYPVWQDMGIAVGTGSGFQSRYDEQPGSYLEQYSLEKSCTAGLDGIGGGAGLSVSGLQMQTVFRNPLAGPSVLGISSGASLGVACVVLLSGAMGGVALSRLGYMGEVALSVAAIIGALSVMALIVYVSQKSKGECNAAHYRCDDRLCGKCRYRRIKIFQCGRGYTGVRYLGLGQFCTCLRRPDAAVCLYHGGVAALVVPADKDHEPVVVGRRLCT